MINRYCNDVPGK